MLSGARIGFYVWREPKRSWHRGSPGNPNQLCVCVNVCVCVCVCVCVWSKGLSILQNICVCANGAYVRIRVKVYKCGCCRHVSQRTSSLTKSPCMSVYVCVSVCLCVYVFVCVCVFM